MGSVAKVKTDLGPVKTWVERAAEEIVTACPWQIWFWWGAPGRGTGDHAKGLALDLTTHDGGTVNNPGPLRNKVGDWVATYAVRDHVRLGLTYVIWNRRIASAASNPKWSWRAYTGSNPHIDHVHMSFETSHIYRPPAGEDDWLMGAREDILAAIAAVRAGIDQEMDAFRARVDALEATVGRIPADVWKQMLADDPTSPWHTVTVKNGLLGLQQAKDAEKARDKEADADRARIEAAVTDGEETP